MTSIPPWPTPVDLTSFKSVERHFADYENYREQILEELIRNMGIPARLIDETQATIYDKMMDDLTEKPDDWALRGMMADWAEDNDRLQMAECLRWTIREKRRPYSGASGGGTWFNKDTIAEGLGDPESDLPTTVYQLLEGGNEVANHKSFPSMRAAEEALQAAWAKLNDGALAVVRSMNESMKKEQAK